MLLLAQFKFGLFFMAVLLALGSIFMMLLILVQQGRGGGLTGALGGMGGQSAFGAKAGDLFTRITYITALIWITLSVLTIAVFNPPINADSSSGVLSTPIPTNPSTNLPAESPPAGDGDAGGAMKLNPPADAVPKDAEPAPTEQQTTPPTEPPKAGETPPSADAPKTEEAPKTGDAQQPSEAPKADQTTPASGETPKSDSGKN